MSLGYRVAEAGVRGRQGGRSVLVTSDPDNGGTGVEPAAAELAREIRRRKSDAGVSNSDLASMVGYSRTYVGYAQRPSRGLPSEHLVTALDRALGAGGVLVALHSRAAKARDERRATVTQTVNDAAPDPAAGSGPSPMPERCPSVTAEPLMPVPVDLYDGLNCGGALDTTARTLARLSGWGMDRRQFLGATIAAAAFAEPALSALTTRSAGEVARTAGRRLGMADVEAIEESVAHFRKLDHRYGSGIVYDQALSLLNIGASSITEGAYSGKVGKALVAAVAQAAWLAGSMSSDIGNVALAQRYYIQTLNLAIEAGDHLYAANVLSHMGRLTVQVGSSAPSADERISYAKPTISLARAGKMKANGGASPALAALLDAIEARGHALIGDAADTRDAVRNAERNYSHARLADEPRWLRFYTEAELSADLGRCLRDVGEPNEGTRLIAHAMECYEPWRVRSRCFLEADLATAHLMSGDHERALDVGRAAVRTAAQVSSSRTLDRLRTLQRRLGVEAFGSPPLADLDSAITALMRENVERSTEGTS